MTFERISVLPDDWIGRAMWPLKNWQPDQDTHNTGISITKKVVSRILESQGAVI